MMTPDSDMQPPAPVKVQSLQPSTHGNGGPVIPVYTPVQEDTYDAPDYQVAADSITMEERKNPFVEYWRKAGGGSLTVSIAIHAALLIAAYFIVETITTPEKPVDFIPGGGSKSGQEASQQQTVQVQQKRRQVMQQSLPMKRLVVEGAKATIALPDLPPDAVDLPALNNSSTGGSMGAGGFGSAGAGLGSGTGIGSGALKGFAGMTFFGKLGGDGIPGDFYDLKQDRKRNPLPYGGGNQADTFRQYAEHINKAAAKRFSPSALNDYYKASQQVNFTYLLVPADTKATEGPKCFNAQNEVQPSGWFVHYGGMITAPEAGEWRFVGFFDDLLVIYINGKPVLDGSWVPMVAQNGRRVDEDIRQEFRGPPISGNRTAYYGKWVRFNGPARIDIVVGETPGGLVGGLIMVEKKGAAYKQRADGTPILPLFSTVALAAEEQKQLHENPFARHIQVADEMPVFKLHRSALEGGAAMELMRNR